MPLKFSTRVSPEKAKCHRLSLAGLTLLMIVPFWLNEYVPLLDLPAHLARVHVQHEYERNSFFQEVLQYTGQPVPNFALDLFAYLLPKAIDWRWIPKLFLSLYVVIFVFSGHRYYMATRGCASWLSLALPFFSYQSTLLNGYVNFLFAQAIFVFAFCCWLEWHEDWTWWRLILASALTCLCLISHVTALFFLGVAAATAWLNDSLRTRHFSARSLIGFLPLLTGALFYFSMRSTGGAAALGAFEWGPLWRKLVSLGAFTLSYNYRIDAVHIVMLLAAATVLLAARPSCSMHPLSGWLAVCFLLLCLVFPAAFLGGTSADQRFAPLALLFAWMSFDLEMDTRWAAWAASLFLGAYLLRTASIGMHWQYMSEETSRQLTALDHLPERSRFFAFAFTPVDRQQEKVWRSVAHVPSYVLLRRQAIAESFLDYHAPSRNNVFSRQPRIHPLDMNSALLGDAQISPEGVLPYLEKRLTPFSWAWVCHADSQQSQFFLDRGVVVSSAPPCVLYHLSPKRGLN